MEILPGIFDTSTKRSVTKLKRRNENQKFRTCFFHLPVQNVSQDINFQRPPNSRGSMETVMDEIQLVFLEKA